MAGFQKAVKMTVPIIAERGPASATTGASELLELNRRLEAELERRQLAEQALETANQTLAARESWLKQILDTANVAIFLVDLAGRITHANRCMAEMFGFSLEELQNKEYVELVHPIERECGRQKMLALLAHAPVAVDLERRYRRADGGEFLGHVTGKLFYDVDGAQCGIVGVIADITESKQVEKALIESETRFREFFEENGSVMLLIESGSGQIALANRAAAAYYGYSLECLIGMSIAEINILPPQEIFLERQRALREERNYFNFRHRLASGEVRDVEVYSAPTKVSGQALLFSIIHDITERKQAEARLQLAASVFTHAREGIMIADADGAIVEVNDTFTSITGYGREEVLGRNPSMLASGRQAPEFYAAMWQSIHDAGHWSGEIWNRRKTGEVYAEIITISAVRDACGETRNYVALFSDITPMKEHQQQLQHIAHYDALTNLPNRVLLADRLQLALAASRRGERSLAVVYLDLDGFKVVNDTHGHDVGDALLIAVAQRMKDVLRGGDTLARIGGDEFVAVLADLERPHDCEAALERLLRAVATPLLVGSAVLQVSASIGVTLYPHDGSDADLLMRHADQAMYMAKLAGKNRYHLFDVVQDTAMSLQRESLEHIRLAVERSEFVLYYQPKVNMKTGRVIGAEALIRWQHPERGLLAPAIFLPIIENHPLGVELGEWVIDTALTQLGQWRSAGLDIAVSVNVGACQLQHNGFVPRLAELLAAHPDVPPDCLELEILETSALEDIVQVSEVMRACCALGVRFALDDFGTGYSSLTYLKRLPAEVLKIDQSFVRNMQGDTDDLSIIEGVISLATAFRRQVIAEGVEAGALGELLLLLGCELAQGFGIARPMPAHELPGWASTWRPDAAWAVWRERAPNRDDRMTVFAEVEHRRWLSSLQSFMAGDSQERPPTDAHECHFDRWLETEGRTRYGENPAFLDAVAIHERMHALGREVIELHVRGQQAAATALLEQLRSLSGELTAKLRGPVREQLLA
jgi:diguanylate cyclase (GGDEF)-like protein/PAS domain S-box-containing protein